MSRFVLHSTVALVITTLIILASTSVIYAETEQVPRLTVSPYDVINAVNALRASYGLAPYGISSILMSTAQNQADYMAATGSVSHTGAGGSSVTDRLLSAGYPLAGDLSFGGFRSENITSGSEGMTAQAAVIQWMGDSVHVDTMTSPNLTEIGAGITVNGGRAYYVIDCARPTMSGEPQATRTSVAGGFTASPSGSVMIPVVVSTPNADGDLIHEVKAGQTLCQIAISYNTKIDEIKRLNNLFDNNIYPGTKLLIRQGVILPSAAPTETATIDAIPFTTNLPTLTVTIPAPTLLSTLLRAPLSASTKRIKGSVIGIIAVALLGGGVFAWLGNIKK